MCISTLLYDNFNVHIIASDALAVVLLEYFTYSTSHDPCSTREATQIQLIITVIWWVMVKMTFNIIIDVAITVWNNKNISNVDITGITCYKQMFTHYYIS